MTLSFFILTVLWAAILDGAPRGQCTFHIAHGIDTLYNHIDLPNQPTIWK